MLYAVMSDIHGNFPALQAVLEDAKRAGAEQYLFAGDYISDFHCTREIYETLRALPNAVFVSGNREWYMETLDPTLCGREQTAGLFQAKLELGEDGGEWVRGLPRSVRLRTPDGEKSILIEHVCEELNGALHSMMGKRKLSSGTLQQEYSYRDATREEVLEFARSFLVGNPLCEDLREHTQADVVIYGHNHLQYAVESDGILFLNPGSVGMPLDHRVGAAYTLLYYEDGKFSVEERRVPYDVERTVQGYRQSPFGQKAAVWGELCIWNFLTARDHDRVFFQILRAEQERLQPQTDEEHNAVFREAFELTRRKFAEEGIP